MNLNYLIPCGCAFGGGLIHRYYYNKYLNDIKDKKIYALITYQYDANIFNQGMFFGLTIGLSYVLLKKYLNNPLLYIKPNFS